MRMMVMMVATVMKSHVMIDHCDGCTAAAPLARQLLPCTFNTISYTSMAPTALR